MIANSIYAITGCFDFICNRELNPNANPFNQFKTVLYIVRSQM